MDIESIANKVNDFFVGLTDHFVPLSQPTPPIEILEEFLVTEREVFKALASLQTSKAIGPDNIPNRNLKEFALELAPVICNIYNQSMKEANIPSPLKSSIVIPVPKISPPQTIENDLRPISLTSTMAKVMEGFTCTRLLTRNTCMQQPLALIGIQGTIFSEHEVFRVYDFEIVFIFRANGAKRRSGRKPGARVTNSALAFTCIRIMRCYIAQWHSGIKSRPIRHFLCHGRW